MSTNVTESLSSGVPESSEATSPEAAYVHTSLEHLQDLYAYNHWLYLKIRPFLTGNVLEVGGGIGNITQFLLNCPQVVSIEPEPRSYQRSKERFRDHLNLEVVQATLQDYTPSERHPRTFDTAICLNVLEHIKDHVEALRLMANLCRPGGQVVILVPAMMLLFGEMDRSFGHYRRYSKRTLRQAFDAAGLRIVHAKYFNMLGALGWFWKGRILKDDQLDTRGCRTFDRLVPYVDAVERLLPKPFGQSLIMVGQR